MTDTPTTTSPDALAGAARVDLDWYAERLTRTQDVRFGPLAARAEGVHPIDPLVVATVLHAMADHTMNTRLMNEVVDGMGLCPPGDPRWPDGDRVVSLGRWFHQVADAIEWSVPPPAEHARTDVTEDNPGDVEGLSPAPPTSGPGTAAAGEAMDTARLDALTDQLWAQVTAGCLTREEYTALESAAELVWSGWLAATHAPTLSELARKAVFEKAWQWGHENGYREVEAVYRSLADLVAPLVTEKTHA